MPCNHKSICLWVQVQVIPWVLSDTNYVRGPHQRLDTSWTVFVGGLHGMLNAGMSHEYR